MRPEARRSAFTSRPVAGFFVPALLVLALGACGERRAPPAPGTPATEVAPSAPAAPPSAPNATAVVLPLGATEVAVEGALIRGDGATLRAVLPLDVDADGDRDAFIVTSHDAAWEIRFARRDGPAFGPAQPLAREPAAPAECAAATVTGAAVSAAHAVLERRCEGPVGTRRTHWLLAAGPVPRVGDRVEIASRSATPTVTLAFSGEDVDGDGHADLRGRFGWPGAASAAEVVVDWLDRAAGLARSGAEPRATLARLGATPESRADLLRVYDTFCAEGSGDPDAVRLGGGAPPTCGLGRETSGARVDAALAAAGAGRVIDAARALARTEPDALGAAWPRVRAALTAAGITRPLTVRPGPVVAPAPPRPETLSRLGWVGPGTVLVRGEAPLLVDTASGAVTPADPQADHGPPTAPDGSLTLTSLGVACGVPKAAFSRPSAVVGKLALAAPAVVVSLHDGPSPTCGEPLLPRRHPLGLRALGWTQQGAVLADGVDAWVLPTPSAASSPAFRLTPEAPLPAPLAPGFAAPGGRVTALPFGPLGILRHTRTEPARLTLLVPNQGWDDRVEDVAIDDSGAQVAFLAAGRLWFGTAPTN